MEYLAVLKNMMYTCKYSATEYNNQSRDRLLHGCKDEDMQKAIIEVGEDLSLDEAVKAALQHEAKLKSLKELSTVSCEEQVNAVFKFKNCWRCGGAIHKKSAVTSKKNATIALKLDTCVAVVQIV